VTRMGGGHPECRPAVLVYRRTFLPISETFVVDHIEGLRHWRAVAGYEDRVDAGLSPRDTPIHEILPARAGRLRRFAYKRLGMNPTLRQVVSHERITLIHAHFLLDGTRVARAALRLGIPLVVTAHGYDATIWDAEHRKYPDGRFMIDNRAALIAAASRILCVSDFIREELIERGFPPDKLVTRRLGVDVKAFSPSPPPEGRRGVLFAGRLVEKKGGALLLAAWLSLPPILRAQGLTIIGDGPEMDRLRALANDNGEVRFLGAQPRDVVHREMQAHRLFAFPSIRASNGDAEGMGIVGIEAQAVGIPVVAFDYGPTRELLIDGQTGLLVPLGDIDALRAALVRILSDDDLAVALGVAGCQHVAERFDLRRNTAAIEDVYDEIAGFPSYKIASP
jgi:colanic acid/amylovoran biosynthesis glycosyltransferase